MEYSEFEYSNSSKWLKSCAENSYIFSKKKSIILLLIPKFINLKVNLPQEK